MHSPLNWKRNRLPEKKGQPMYYEWSKRCICCEKENIKQLAAKQLRQRKLWNISESYRSWALNVSLLCKAKTKDSNRAIFWLLYVKLCPTYVYMWFLVLTVVHCTKRRHCSSVCLSARDGGRGGGRIKQKNP